MIMSALKIAAAVSAPLVFVVPALAQTNPNDPAAKVQADSPTTKAKGMGAQPADQTPGQKPATDPQSNKQLESPTTNGVGSGDQGSDSTAGQEPESKIENEYPASK
jgi:hypothetical protein